MHTILSIKEKMRASLQIGDMLTGLIGGTCSIFTLLLLSKTVGHLYIMAPFGATCVLLYAASKSPLAQPKNIILGHLISALIGLLFLKFLPISMLSIAISVGCAIAFMQLFKCVHPPAGANPLVILLTAHTTHYDWLFLIFPVLSGSVILVIISMAIHKVKYYIK
ncbi:HPP family protein [Acinetobacter boissieri]|uniref:HPP family protein n=1 Tax=Acinetobacter boissieri TaxID=1219383 RepID=A0A1G6GMB1_9GAMM|nr:HPP family protein [Acinetobacter boissieri]SDB82973.1 HPP family protein [Acinetobacter boissieri]